MRLLVTIILALLSLSGFSSPEEPQLVFDQANALYSEGKIEEALEKYESIARSHGSWELDYNIGNCHFKSGNIGSSILYYERALRKKPQSTDIQHNLDQIRNRTVDKVEYDDTGRLSDWWGAKILAIGADKLAVLSIILAILVLFCMGIYLFVRTRSLKRWGFGLMIGSFIACVLLYAVSVQAKGLLLATDQGVVMSAKVDVKSSPNEVSKDLFILHEGTKVDLVRKNEDWFEIILPNGEKGWLRSKDIEVI